MTRTCCYCSKPPTEVLVWTDRRAAAADGADVAVYRDGFCAEHIEQGHANMRASVNAVVVGELDADDEGLW